ncbi:MAG: class I SAM-dependent methyltransferase [Candidatus Promineifilaceae bacterium]|nr:class I SAM-dependent methyltransferase [Candidatus Promineifilaceae bacterium]
MSAEEPRRLASVYKAYRADSSIVSRWSTENAGNRLILRERNDALAQLLAQHEYIPLTGRRVLDLGCGSGDVLASLSELGADAGALIGMDLLPERVSRALQKFPTIDFLNGNGENLSFPAQSFDLVLLFTVFTSILDLQVAQNVAAEVERILRPGGSVVWYDFRYDNPRNPHVRGVTRREISALFPSFTRYLHPITLFPPLARRLGPFTMHLYPLLARLPFLRTHYLGLLIKPQVEERKQKCR